MDWDNVRVFLGVARAGQFLAAARQLKIDHATVARRMTALERSLNARLLDRRTTGVSLTAAGQRFLSAAERMETEILHAQAELTDQDFELSGTVRLGAPDGLSTYYLAAKFSVFMEKHPGITIQVVPTPQVVPLSKREVDIAIVLDKPEAGRFVTRKLSDYSLGIFGAKRYLATHPTPMTVEALSHHQWVGYVEDYNASPALNYVSELCGTASIGFQSASAIGQLEAVRAGLGLGVLHDFIVERHDDLVRVLPERRAYRSYWIVEHEDTRGLGRIRAVHDFLVSSIEEDRSIFIKRS